MMKLQVIKVGGAVVEDAAAVGAFLDGFAALEGPKVLVHGGGRSATALAAQLDVPTVMVGGRRVTDAAMLRIVTMVYAGEVNKTLVAALQGRGVNALGLCGADLGWMRSTRRPAGEVDYGFVGDVCRVDTTVLVDLIARGVVPVLAPLTHDGQGQLLNTNADSIASEAAKAFARDFDVTLTFCFEHPGVLRDPADAGSVIPQITRDDYRKYLDQGVISGGMIPKLDNAYAAIDAGVSRVVITRWDALQPGQGTLIQ